VLRAQPVTFFFLLADLLADGADAMPRKNRNDLAVALRFRGA
jgi:hypothetical protein